MPTTLDDDHVSEILRAMYLEGERPGPPITALELRRQAPRQRLRVGFKLPAAVAAALVLIVVLYTATPLRHNGQPAQVLSQIPKGWSSHTAYGIQISIPDGWEVSYFPVCADGGQPGRLNIGAPKTPGACSQVGQNSVTITKNPGTTPIAIPNLSAYKRISVNGLSVLADTSGLSTQWYVEADRVSIFAYGPDISKVLATVRGIAPKTT
jgi:hypothetical protein